jgi:hypothetical protein
MTMLHQDVDDWLPIIRAEYIEFPGLQLTRAQVQRLWNLDEATCAAVSKRSRRSGSSAALGRTVTSGRAADLALRVRHANAAPCSHHRDMV